MIHIVACADNNYIPQAGILFYSIIKNNPNEEFTFHLVIDDSVTPKSKQDIKRTIRNNTVCFYQIDSTVIGKLPRLDDSNSKSYITKATYYRLFLTAFLPNNIEKMIYLDCDMLVLGSLTDLWMTQIDDYAVAAVMDMSEVLPEKYERLNYKKEKGYFNAGMLLINLNFWRNNKLLEQYLNFIDKYPERILLHDQDVLNYVLQDKKKSLSLIYNVQDGFYRVKKEFDYTSCKDEVESAIRHPVILHYSGQKPWNWNCDHPLKYLFKKYKDETLWKDTLNPKIPFHHIITSNLRRCGFLPKIYVNVCNH